MGHRRQQLARFAAPVETQELFGPAVDLVLGIEVLALDQPQQIGHVLGAIGERVAQRMLLDLKIESVARRVVEPDHAFKAQLLRPAGEPSDRDAVAEDIVHPTKRGGFGSDDQPGVEQPLVIAVARPQHHAVLAKGDRLLVAVGGNVSHGDDRH